MKSILHKTVLITRFPYEAILSGEEWHTITLAEELRNRGWKVIFMGSCPVLSVELKKREFEVYKVWAGKLPVSKPSLAVFLLMWPLFTVKLFFAFKKIEKVHSIDSVYMLSLTEKVLLTPFLKCMGKIVLWVEHQRFGDWMYKNPLRIIYERWSQKVQIAGVSAMHVEQLSLLKVPKDNIHCITNGIDTEFFSPEGKKFIYEEGAFVTGTVARYFEDKGLDLLIRAFAEVVHLSREKNMKLLLMGEGPEEAALKDLTINCKIEDKVVFLEPYKTIPRENMPDFYRGLDIFVLPSRKHDPFGLVAAEAMSSGIPTVVTNVCGISTHLQNAQDAIIVKPGDSGAIAEGMLKILHCSELRKQLGNEGRKTAVEKFSLKRMVDEYEKLL